MSIDTHLALIEVSLVFICIALLFHVAAWGLYAHNMDKESEPIWRAKPKQRECPRCGYVIAEDGDKKTSQKYCGNCGLLLFL